MIRRILLDLTAVAVLAGVYFVAGRLGLSLATVHPSASAVWPPTGIALAALLIYGQRLWPGILIGAFLVNFTTSGHLVSSFLIALGNTFEGVLCAFLVDRFAAGRRAFDRAGDAFRYALLAGLVGTAVSATIGSASLMLTELAQWPAFGPIWWTWWLGDAGGALIVAPVLILWANDHRIRWNQEYTIEALLLLFLLLLCSTITFGKLSPFGVANYPLEFIVVPLVVWTAYRLGQRETATATLALSAIAVWGTLNGHGPFARESANESLLLLQAFNAVVAMTGLGVAAMTYERRQVEDAVRGINEQLRGGLTQMQQRNVEMGLFSEMSHLLQGCLTLAEAYAVLQKFAPRLFHGVRGGVYILSESRSLVEAAVVWGAPPIRQRLFATEDCWALRRGHPHHVVSASETALPCRHLESPAPAATICVPMIAQGETVGMLYLATPPLAPADRLNDLVRQFGQTVADGVALTLTNLRLRESLRQQSIRDPLTDLFNRRYLDETLERELRRARRNQSTVGVIMIDIDHFKAFNDKLGHAAGDVMLRLLGSFLRSSIRNEDIACRYGGEEFLLLLPDTSLATAHQRARDLRAAAHELHLPFPEEQRLPVTLSLGVAVYPDHGATAEAVLRAADGALYKAKCNGRDQVVVFGAAGDAPARAQSGGG